MRENIRICPGSPTFETLSSKRREKKMKRNKGSLKVQHNGWKQIHTHHHEISEYKRQREKPKRLGREKQVTHEGSRIRMSSDFSKTTLEAEENGEQYLQKFEKKIISNLDF